MSRESKKYVGYGNDKMYIELDMAIIGEMIFDSLVSNMRDR
jgi:hypothetical protein